MPITFPSRLPAQEGQSRGRLGRNSCAFTLIELLVLLCVGALLVALLIPTRGSVRVRSRVLECQNNLKQLAMGWRMYAEDHADRIVGPGDGTVSSWRIRPGFGEYYAPPTHPLVTNVWSAVQKFDSWGYRIGGLSPYAPGTNIINCPGNPNTLRAQLPTFNSYNMVDGLGFGSLRIGNTAGVLHPAERFLWMEEAGLRSTLYDGWTFGETLGTWLLKSGDPPGPADGPTWGLMNWYDSPASFHLNGANFIYADGHAEWRRWADLDTVRFTMDPPWGRANAGFLNVTADLIFVAERYPSALNP